MREDGTDVMITASTGVPGARGFEALVRTSLFERAAPEYLS
jgi:hypothetical protein